VRAQPLADPPPYRVLFSLSPDRRYKKKHVFIGGFIPGPNNPQNLDSFLFSGLAHLSTIQKGLCLWDSALQHEIQFKVFLALLTADGPGMMHILFAVLESLNVQLLQIIYDSASRDDACSGVQPLWSRESTSAPSSMSKRTTLTFPLTAALSNGVWLLALRALISIPRPNNDFKVSMFPSSAAMCNETLAPSFPSSSAPYSTVSNVVDRNSFRVFAFALYSEMNFATSAWPFYDANSAAVLLALLSTSTSGPRRSNSFTTPRCPRRDAACNSVQPLLSAVCTVAPWSIRRRAIAAFPFVAAR
jgi:hypothetical protein